MILFHLWKLKKNLNKLNLNIETEIVVVCHQGDVGAPEAYQMLINKGFSNVRILKGGMAGYIEHDKVPLLLQRFS